jgi:DNA-binding NtrC family response regulator
VLRVNKIMVVDDEPYVCQVLEEFLESKGYRVVCAYSGDEALALYSKESPDLVLLDIRMPGKDGIETLKELRAMDPEAGVFMVTGVLEEDVAKKARHEGAYEYITKPVNPFTLELLIERWIKSNYSVCE